MSDWRFFLDENVDPKVEPYLRKEGIDAVHVRDALGQGTSDADIVSYTRERGLVVLTSDLGDFGPLPVDDHPGVVLLHDDTLPAYRVASAVIRLVDAYPSRKAFDGRETLDAWA
jgi:predicted nuclease of predicted toxin-antitoxin system